MRRGVSLLEIVLAFALIAIGVIALATVFISGLKLAGNSQDLSVASQMANEIFERARHDGFDNLPKGNVFFDGKVPDPPTGTFPAAPYPARDGYTLQVESRFVAPRLRAVRVKVVWARGSYSTETLIHP